MPLQFRISGSRDKRPAYKTFPRTLLRLRDFPDSPTLHAACCEAVEHDGNSCRAELPSNPGDPFCSRHYKEWRELNAKWSKTHQEAERLIVINADVAKQKVMNLRLSVELRRQIRDQFYPRGGDIQDYIKWINILETDNLNRGPTPGTPEKHTGTPHPNCQPEEKITILQSQLDPHIPVNSLAGMPDDGITLILKHFYLDLCADSIRRLYSIVPDLNDSKKRNDSPSDKDQPHADTGTDILRAWFRIMVLNDSEAPTLEHATRSKSIHEFLHGCQASQIEMYCDFFENAWRPHAAQYLRVAICAQTLTAGDIKTTYLIGGTIPSSTEGIRMTKPCWDILYRWFPTLLTPWTIASICSNFEDYNTICKLIMLSLYNQHWYDTTSILSECATGVYMGFIPTSKGNFSANASLYQEGQLWVQRQSRNYLCGQMAIGDPLTQAFLNELRKRTAALYLVVYEGTHADAIVHTTKPDLFISRHRSAMNLDELDKGDYSVTLTLEDIKNELRMRKSTMYDPIVVDSWQFIIIDREVGLPFRLMDIVQDTLLMLVGDPSPRQLAKSVIREVIPPSIQEIFLEELHISCSADLRYSPPGEVQHEGNRYRCYDPDTSVLVAKRKKMNVQQIGRDDNRFIRRCIEDMERYGVITLISKYEKPQTRPIIVQGADGSPDLYFPYEEEVSKSGGGEPVPALPFPEPSCLMDFAKAYKEQNPDGIMAKGSIQTHYCAWPMPAIKSLGRSGLNFATWEGHIYRWNAMPFDRPSSAHAWQYYIQHLLNSKYPFVMFYLTTFVICATDLDDAEEKTIKLLDEMDDRGWKANLPHIDDWTTEIDHLKLDKLFNGVRPM